MVKGFTHWIAIAPKGFTPELRKVLLILSRQASAGEATPPFVTRELKRQGVVITNGHIQSLN